MPRAGRRYYYSHGIDSAALSSIIEPGKTRRAR